MVYGSLDARILPPKLMPLTVVSATLLTKRTRRLTFFGSDLAEIPEPKAGQWVKLFPDLSGTERHGRPYTISSFSRSDRSLQIDVTLHGKGAFSKWAAAARCGDTVESSLPCGMCKIPSGAQGCVFAGDETAAPAILSILRSLPRGIEAKAFIEIGSDNDIALVPKQYVAHVHWLSRESGRHAVGSLLTHAIMSTSDLASKDVWLAGEQKVVATLRGHCLRTCGIKSCCLQAAGYWKQGTEEYRDEKGEY